MHIPESRYTIHSFAHKGPRNQRPGLKSRRLYEPLVSLELLFEDLDFLSEDSELFEDLDAWLVGLVLECDGLEALSVDFVLECDGLDARSVDFVLECDDLDARSVDFVLECE